MSGIAKSRRYVICAPAEQPGAKACCTVRVLDEEGREVSVPLSLDASILLMRRVTAAVLAALPRGEGRYGG